VWLGLAGRGRVVASTRVARWVCGDNNDTGRRRWTPKVTRADRRHELALPVGVGRFWGGWVGAAGEYDVSSACQIICECVSTRTSRWPGLHLVRRPTGVDTPTGLRFPPALLETTWHSPLALQGMTEADKGVDSRLEEETGGGEV